MKLSNDRYISLSIDLAEALAARDDETLETVLEANGDERYTEDSQDLFNYYYEEAQDILEGLNIEQSEEI